MKYMMFVVADPDAAAEAEAEGTESEVTIDEWLAEVEGKRVAGDRLRPVDDATTVRVSKGEVLVSDGPFTESKDWIAGFDIIECADLDEAIAIAARHPQAADAYRQAVGLSPGGSPERRLLERRLAEVGGGRS